MPYGYHTNYNRSQAPTFEITWFRVLFQWTRGLVRRHLLNQHQGMPFHSAELHAELQRISETEVQSYLTDVWHLNNHWPIERRGDNCIFVLDVSTCEPWPCNSVCDVTLMTLYRCSSCASSSLLPSGGCKPTCRHYGTPIRQQAGRNTSLLVLCTYSNT